MSCSTNDLSPDSTSPPSKLPNRWLIALAGMWLQLFLGTVYAWSYFQQPLVDTYGWAHTQVAWTFSLAICCLGLAAAWAGKKLPDLRPAQTGRHRRHPLWRRLSAGCPALHWRSLALLYLGYGVIGGTGLGLGYVTPVATVAKWFPDRKGLATGLVIMGFGFGALLMSKLIAPALYSWSGGNLAVVFAGLGVCFTAATLLGALPLRDPPPGYAPYGMSAPVPANARPHVHAGRPRYSRYDSPRCG